MKKNMGILASAGTIGLHFVTGPAVGFGIGYLLDGWLGTHPWMKGIFFFFGILAAFKMVYEDAMKLVKETENPRDQGTDPPA